MNDEDKKRIDFFCDRAEKISNRYLHNVKVGAEFAARVANREWLDLQTEILTEISKDIKELKFELR